MPLPSEPDVLLAHTDVEVSQPSVLSDEELAEHHKYHDALLPRILESFAPIAKDNPPWDCWPSPIRGWEVVVLVRAIDDLRTRLAASEARAERLEKALNGFQGEIDDCECHWPDGSPDQPLKGIGAPCIHDIARPALGTEGTSQ
jgi:hypothetical protein